MAISPNGQFVYVANVNSDSVSVISTATNTVVATISTGPNPIDIAVTPDNARLYVANVSFYTTAGNVAVIDATSNTVLTTIPVGHHPDGIAVTPDGAFAYVGTTGCCGGPNTVSVIDTSTNTVTTAVPGGMNPVAIAVASLPDPETATPTSTETPTPTATASPSATAVPTETATLTVTPTVSETSTATPTPLCLEAPRTGCRTAGKSVFLLKAGDESTRKVVWKWLRGLDTDLVALGNPVAGSTDYGLCVYGSSSGTPGSVITAVAEGGTMCGGDYCWQPTGTKGFKYIEPSGSAAGLVKIVLRTGGDGKAKILVKVKGAHLLVPTPADPNNLLRQDPTVAVQLVNSSGECWEAIYAAPATSVTVEQFKDQF